MARRISRGIGLLLALALMCSLGLPALAAQEPLPSLMADSAAYLLQSIPAPQVGSIGGEWAVIALARSEAAVPQEFWHAYYAEVEAYVTACRGVLHERKYTEYARLVLALTAIGADPTDVVGYDLLTPLGDYDKTVWQGLSGPIWALIALDSGSYEMPVNADAATQATRQMYLEHILFCQLEGGGWSLGGQGGAAADPDITAMALQALARYRDQSAVQAAIDRALSWLSATQNSRGGFSSWGTENLESCAQVLVALGELGISPRDERFVKNGHSLLEAVLSYRQADGSFLHTMDGGGSAAMACEQGLYALAAAWRKEQGKSSLYRMEDVALAVPGSDRGAGLPGKHRDVVPTSVKCPGVRFDDMTGHENQTAVLALAARGILNGKGDGRFDPDADMTRAEFAATVVRALGLPPQGEQVFTDVNARDWYASSIATAYSYGLIQGVGEGKFDPAGSITRQQAALLMRRAAALCGMDTQMGESDILDILARFTDGDAVADWARDAVAFCYDANILEQSDLTAQPLRPILRCQIAQMLYNLLGRARLL